jgi:hypothetical protein
MDTSLEWKIVVGRRRFTSGHRTEEGDEEKRKKNPQQSWKKQVADFMRSRKVEEDMTENRHIWPLGIDSRTALSCIDLHNKKILHS